ncbi:glycosylphosphatidylinositol anchor biosynthesis [Thecaphora frezii]
MDPTDPSTAQAQHETLRQRRIRPASPVVDQRGPNVARAATPRRAGIAGRRRLFALLLAFRLINALLTRTYFQPDEHWQSQEVAHTIVFGYGFVTWEWFPSSSLVEAQRNGYLSAAWHNLFNGPLRGVLHPLVFVPLYWLLKVTRLDGTFLLVLAPRLQQAVFAAIGDLYTFKLADRVAGTAAAYCTLLVSLTNLYSFFTATRTFSNTLEATITIIALYYWPFIPLASWSSTAGGEGVLRTSEVPSSQDLPTDASLDRTVSLRKLYCRTLSRSLWLAALACLLRPTNGVIWIFLFGQLLYATLAQLPAKSRERGSTESACIAQSIEVIAEVGSLIATTARVAIIAICAALMLDTAYFSLADTTQRPAFWPKVAGYPLPLPTLTPLSFFHRNVVASLSLFYGVNPWHFFLSQGIPVLCTTWLPFTLLGWRRALKASRPDLQPLRSLAYVVLWTVGIFSLLGHKEFRFLQPILPLLCLFTGLAFASCLPPASTWTEKGGDARALLHVFCRLPAWMKGILLFLQLPAAIFVTTFHCRGQEAVTYHLGRAARKQAGSSTLRQGEVEDPYGRIRSIGMLMPCHSTPWQSSLHWSAGAPADDAVYLWFIECPPPGPGQELDSYMDQSDFFYADPYAYLLPPRFPIEVDPSFPPSPAGPLRSVQVSVPIAAESSGNIYNLGWRHTWPSHLVVFGNLLWVKSKDGSDTVGSLLARRGYSERKRFWNSFKHEDNRRDGDIVVLAHASVEAT